MRCYHTSTNGARKISELLLPNALSHFKSAITQFFQTRNRQSIFTHAPESGRNAPSYSIMKE